MPTLKDPNTLFRLAEHLLSLADKELKQAGITPGRASVDMGTVAMEDDCCNGQLSVSLKSGPSAVQPMFGKSSNYMTSWLVTYTVTWFGCYPTGLRPDGRSLSGDVFTSASESIYQALGAVWKAYSDAVPYGGLYPPEPGAGNETLSVAVSPAQPVEPQGGCAGWELDVTLEVPC